MRSWMIAPDRLAQKMDALNGRGAGAALRAVNPAVGAPCQTVRNRMRIFQPEP